MDASNPSSGSFIESLKGRTQALEICVTATAQTPAIVVNADDRAVQCDGVASLEPPSRDLRNSMQQVSYLSLSTMAESTDCQFSADPQGLSFLTLLFAAANASGSNPSLPVGANDGLSTSLLQLRKGAFPHGINLQTVDSSHFFQRYVDTMAVAYSFMTTLELNDLYHSVMAAHNTSTLERMANQTPEKLVIVYVACVVGKSESIKWAVEGGDKCVGDVDHDGKFGGGSGRGVFDATYFGLVVEAGRGNHGR